ncbi:MAG: WYL domain-containing protein [Bacteroidales bacterium]|nr:WYL domain-containing protein [Bacteroidales bacterium]
MDTKSLISNYVWLIDFIRRRGKVPYKEINKAWQREGRDGGMELSKRTFLRHINDIADIFGIDIECEGFGEYNYFITYDDSKSNTTKTWLLNSMSLHNFVCESQQLKKRILLENIPSGQKFLTTMIEAIRDQRKVHIWHQGFGKEESNFIIDPYCVKLYRQRWYVLAKSELGVRIYALDRINNAECTDKKIKLPDTNPEEIFENIIGVSIISGKVEHIILKAYKGEEYGHRDCYLRSLPLHSSQIENAQKSTDEYAIFEYNLKPTYEFVQELLTMQNEVEIVEPISLRKHIMEIVESIGERYKTKARKTKG